VVDVDFICDSSYLAGSQDCSILDFAEYKVGDSGQWQSLLDSESPKYTESWSINWSLLTEGVNDVYVRTCDVAGNLYESPDPIKVKKDTQQPNIIINKDEYGWYSQDPGNIIDVDFTSIPSSSTSKDFPNHSNLTNAQYKVGTDGTWTDIFNKKMQEFTTDWSVDWEQLNQGENIIFLRVVDTVGNKLFDQSYNISVYKDVEVPIIKFNQNSYGWFNSDPGDIIDVDFLASNDEDGYVINSPLKKAMYKLDYELQWTEIFNFETVTNIDIYNYSTNWAIDWAKIKEGNNYVSINLVDFADNSYEYTDQLRFQCDKTSPEPPELISPTDMSKTTDTTPQHSWKEPNDPGSNETVKYIFQLSTVGSFSNNLVDVETSSNTFTHAHKLAFGIYNWRVKGIDGAGNIGEWSQVWRFEVASINTEQANQPPNADAGEDVAISIGETVWFDGYASSDPENDPLSYLWYIENNPDPVAEGVRVFWKFDEKGDYTITLEVFDDHGGSDKDSLVVKVLDFSQDSDNDSIPDSWEEFYGLDPNDPSDALEDLDNDGYINSLEYSKGSSLEDSYSTPGSVLDSVAPEIVHIKVEKGRIYESIEISAIVTDKESGLKQVNLYYRKKSDNQYYSISMGHENPYKAFIPASFATLDDIEYYIEAIDNAKNPNIAYFANEGQISIKPIKSTDIDIDISEDYRPLEESNMLDEFVNAFDFGSLEVCLIVFLIMIVLICSFVFSVYRVSKARNMAKYNRNSRTIQVQRDKSMQWEGFEKENINEEEDLNLIDDDFELDQV
jgi:hypothetical protein